MKNEIWIVYYRNEENSRPIIEMVCDSEEKAKLQAEKISRMFKEYANYFKVRINEPFQY